MIDVFASWHTYLICGHVTMNFYARYRGYAYRFTDSMSRVTLRELMMTSRMTLISVLIILVSICFPSCYSRVYSEEVHFDIYLNKILATNNITTVGKAFGLTWVRLTLIIKSLLVTIHCVVLMEKIMLKILLHQLGWNT